VDDDILHISSQLSIPRDELSFRFSKSSGPGGQHAQKSSTRVELLFDIANSPSLTGAQRAILLRKLGSHVDSAGVLHVVSQSERSQFRNRQEVVSRFESLLRQALKRRRPRKATRPSTASRERRLQEKRERSQVKRWRKRVRGDD
jgi:ribosome-associated protein